MDSSQQILTQAVSSWPNVGSPFLFSRLRGSPRHRFPFSSVFVAPLFNCSGGQQPSPFSSSLSVALRGNRKSRPRSRRLLVPELSFLPRSSLRLGGVVEGGGGLLPLSTPPRKHQLAQQLPPLRGASACAARAGVYCSIQRTVFSSSCASVRASPLPSTSHLPGVCDAARRCSPSSLSS